MRSLSLSVLAGILFAAACVTTVHAQQTAPDVRIAGPIDNTELVTLKGNVLPAANAKNDRGPVSDSLPMRDLVLVLSRSPEQQAAFDAYVQNEYDSSSPDFHQWLTPDEIGNRFGPSLADIATVSNWLSSQGFAVTGASKDRMSITFSGTAGQVETTFHTSIHNLSVNGVAHLANMTNPEIPAALAPVVMGIKQLHDFHPHPLHRVGSLVQYNQELGGWQRTGSPVGGSAVLSPLALGSSTPGSTALNATASGAQAARPRPLFTSTSNGFVEDDVTPNDFATIYNVQPLWSSNITGTGQKIVIVGTSNINLSDVSSYKTTFGLPAGSAPIIQPGVNGYNPGVCTSTSTTASCTIGDLEENTLDVEVSGGVATGAQVVLVTSGYNNANANLATNDAIYDSAKWIEDNVAVASSSVYGAHSMSVSYGLCELYEGTSGNVSYYNLWQTAAAEGLAVFTASGDAGSPACDQGQDSYGVPYAAQYGLGVSGVASTPFNTAVGGTDFSWCNPTIIQTGSNEGNATGCAATNASPYWNASNATNLSSAKGYVPEIPWNDTCENPIWAAYLESVATFLGTTGVSTPEEACSYVEENWYNLYETQNAVIAGYVDTVGTGGGQSNCVVNTTAGTTAGTCNSSATSVTTANGSVTLSHDGWSLPSWQTGVPGTSGLTARAVPDVSFFSGDGGLDSATLICLAAASSGVSCTSGNASTTALEIGGTSVASPEMAGVMALIDQKWGNQGLPNKQLYQLAAMQTYSSCSAESVATSSSCYFQGIDQGTNAMPCNTGEVSEGGITYEGNNEWSLTGTYAGANSSNCTAINSGDVIGTLISSGTTPAYNATAGYNMATGLGSLNVANVANNSSVWALVGTTAATVTVQPASSSITANQSLSVTITVAGSSGQPTGNVTLSGSGYTSAATALTNGAATIVIPASSFTGTGNTFSVTLTASYTGDATYAGATGTADVTVTKLAPTVTVTPAASATNSNVPFDVSVTVAGTGGTPTGTVTLTAGSYTSSAATLSNGTYKFTIPQNTFLSSGAVALNVAYSGDTTYTTGSGSSSVLVTYIAVVAPVVTVTPASSTVNSAQSLNVTVAVAGTNGIATGTISLAGGGYSSAVETLANGAYAFTIPAGSFTTYGQVTLTATYSGDGDYLGKTGTANITVTQSVYALTGSAPAAVAPGATATSTITGQTSSTGYTGTVTLKTCTMTSSSVTSPTSPPNCTVSGSITFAAGAATGSGTATVTTTGNVAMLDTMPGGKGWLRTGGGAMLAFLVFLGIPAKRRSWRGLLGMVVLLAALGGLSACGGGSINSGGGGGSSATSAGTYTFTVSGQGSDAASTAGSGTFTVTVN
ncbi:MAG TPA: protease pro-enzyme activation domain-containing protein [Terracidiphilus sp.]|nr:protease pro-enzyme activation domain-containing protein [Terracidiphilus sp.]